MRAENDDGGGDGLMTGELKETHKERTGSGPSKKFVAPDFKRRQLLFDSFAKLRLVNHATRTTHAIIRSISHTQDKSTQQRALLCYAHPGPDLACAVRRIQRVRAQ